jgi:RNA polymerase sigma-70 factor, ECF subfamily
MPSLSKNNQKGGSAMNEMEIIQRCKAGDKSAFAALAEGHRQLMENVARRIVKDPETVKEILQEVLMRIYKGISTFNGKCKLSTWIYRITTNESLRYVQKRSNRDTLPMDLIKELPADDVGALQLLVLEERKEIIHNLISQLSPDFKEVVHSFYFENLKLEEIAVKLNLPQGTVHSRIGRAKNILRKKMMRMAA